MIDPIPDIHALFVSFNGKFFKGSLACVELEWSKKMYQCAGICYSKRSRGAMSCIIRLSEPLLKLRSRKELIETLLHEMIHAWNFVRGILEENGGHGKNFLSKMNEINQLAGTNITVYHTFHDEVELYKKHWWQCDGPCKSQKPFFGLVKRTSNRAPGPNDFWWSKHQQTCGGKFIKIKEPEKVQKKREAKPKSAVKKPKLSNSGTDIRKFFPNQSFSDDSLNSIDADDFGVVKGSDLKSPRKGNVLGGNGMGTSVLIKKTGEPSTSGGGFKLGGSSNGRSRLLDMFEKSQKKIDTSNERKRKAEEAAKEVNKDNDDLNDDDDIIFIDGDFDDSLGLPKDLQKYMKTEPIKSEDTCNCPICNKLVSVNDVNSHLDECLTLKALETEI
jgi:predicted SprT family Zn-dependent metalloprotease